MRKRKDGKQRLDRYYLLAKQQGYRARSAFKLIQLAERHNLFLNCQSTIDLCAAPGGWLQVLQKNLPMGSLILGVDLAPIKPIKGVITLQADVTQPRCSKWLQTQINSFYQQQGGTGGRDRRGVSATREGKVDLVLHDGAPNVGVSWLNDAYRQNELTLHATKVATSFLKPGGAYLTKIFRSSDYNSLLWVLQQLFSNVHSTKPQSSRSVSAEIFVLCRGFKAPHKVDPKFFDPKHVFLSVEHDEGAPLSAAVGEEEEEDPSSSAKRKNEKRQKRPSKGLGDLLKAKGKKNRGGYEPGDDYRECVILDFLACADAAECLTKHNRLLFPNVELSHVVADSTSQERSRNFQLRPSRTKPGGEGRVDDDALAETQQGDEASARNDGTTETYTVANPNASALRNTTASHPQPDYSVYAALVNHSLLTPEIRELCADLKVLGKADLAKLMKVRFKIRREASSLELLKRYRKDGDRRKSKEESKMSLVVKDDSEESGAEQLPHSCEDSGDGAESSSRNHTRAGSAADKCSSHSTEDETDEELERLTEEVQRTQRRELKRQRLLRKRSELRKERSYETTFGAIEEEDLFRLSNEVEEALEHEDEYVAVDADAIFSDTDEKQARRSTRAVADPLLALPNGEQEEKTEEDSFLSDGEDGSTGQDSVVRRLRRMELDMTVQYELKKDHESQAAQAKLVKKRQETRRQRVAAEWSKELQMFNENLDGLAETELAQQVSRYGYDSDDERQASSEQEEEDDNVGQEDYHSCEEEAEEASDDDKEDEGERPEGALADGALERPPRCTEREKSMRHDVSRDEAVGNLQSSADVDSRRIRAEAERWYSQPLFQQAGVCGPEMQTTFGKVGATSEASEVRAAKKSADSKKLFQQKAVEDCRLKRRRQKSEEDEGRVASCHSDDMANVGSRLLTCEAANEQDVAEEEEEETPGSHMVELGDDQLPTLPLPDKKIKQLKRRREAEKEALREAKRSRTLHGEDMLPALGASLDDKGNTKFQEVPLESPIAPKDPNAIAEIQALGSLMISRRSRMDLLDGAYNRYAFQDDHELPTWFVEDESKHNVPELPVSKELMKQYRDKIREINSRPIRKVQEARARKKIRQKRRLEKVRKQAESISEKAELSEGHKAQTIGKLMRKAKAADKDKEKMYVVSRRAGFSRAAQGQAKGKLKKRGSRVAVVDRRLKKDKRAQKFAAKKKAGHLRKRPLRRLPKHK